MTLSLSVFADAMTYYLPIFGGIPQFTEDPTIWDGRPNLRADLRPFIDLFRHLGAVIYLAAQATLQLLDQQRSLILFAKRSSRSPI